MSGYTGLDYAALPVVLTMLDIPQDQHKDIFADLRVMEHAALTIINEKE